MLFESRMMPSCFSKGGYIWLNIINEKHVLNRVLLCRITYSYLISFVQPVECIKHACAHTRICQTLVRDI